MNKKHNWAVRTHPMWEQILNFSMTKKEKVNLGQFMAKKQWISYDQRFSIIYPVIYFDSRANKMKPRYELCEYDTMDITRHATLEEAKNWAYKLGGK